MLDDSGFLMSDVFKGASQDLLVVSPDGSDRAAVYVLRDDVCSVQSTTETALEDCVFD